MALMATVPCEGIDRVVLEEAREGVYILAFRSAEDRLPYRDWLQDSWENAKLHALEDFGVAEDAWQEIPDTGIMSSA